jgi:Ser/Thr protein kinase RdoA (MazF antagonist)
VTSNNQKPYENLDPNLILTAIESAGYLCSGSLLALNSYENRVYQVGIEKSTPLIAKFYRPHRWSNEAIIEEHQFSLELVEHEIPVIAPLANADGETLHEYQNYRFALFPRRGGHALEQDNLDQLEWMGRFIGRLHAVAACRPFQHRGALNAQTHGYLPYQFLIKNNFIPAYLKTQYCEIVDAALKLIDQLFANITDLKLIRLHGDCHLGNVLWNDAGPHIVDLDDAVMGPAIQDIWMLLSGDILQTRLQLSIILDAYNEFYDFDMRELQLIEAMRTLRMIQYSAWLANRWQDPAFPMAFPWFNTAHYWNEQLVNLNDQLIILNDPPSYSFY